MKVLMVKPNKQPYLTEIDGSLKSMQEAVGGYIQITYPYEELVGLVCNEEGKILGLPPNRFLYDEETGTPYDLICGDFFLAGLAEDSLTDFPDDLAEHFTELYRL